MHTAKDLGVADYKFNGEMNIRRDHRQGPRRREESPSRSNPTPMACRSRPGQRSRRRQTPRLAKAFPRGTAALGDADRRIVGLLGADVKTPPMPSGSPRNSRRN